MKMKQEKIRKIGIASALGLVVLVMLGLYGASNYMLNYSLNYPKEERMTAEHWKNRMKNECPWMIGWMDSVYQHHCVKDTFVTMPSGYKAHAIYLYAPEATEKTASVRAVECIVRYKFNTVKTKYKGKGAGKKEMDRL